MRIGLVFATVVACGGCGDDASPADAGSDAARVDAANVDGGEPLDAGPGLDAGPAEDAGPEPDAGPELDAGPPGPGGSLRFYGNGGLRGDRVLVRIDDPADARAGPPIDVGDRDFTIELWMRARAADNPNPAIGCGDTNDWVTSNIFVDRDRHSQPPSYGIGIANRRLVWAVQGPGGDPVSHCGSAIVTDGAWHHVAVQRRRSDGRMWIWVDGALDFEGDGPDGDISYPNDGVPLDVCPDGSCDYSDPFLSFGAEKHGYSGISYNGYLDEIRISTTLRYTTPFPPPTAPFSPDADTVALYHLDEGAGTTTADSSGVAADQRGELVRGGDPPGPDWSNETPF
jgi:hypothetical protein